MLKVITDFLKECPQLSQFNLSADFLHEECGAVSVQGMTCEPVIGQYADGASLRQFVFAVLLRADTESLAEGKPEAFFSAVESWLSVSVPRLEDGKTAQRFETIKTGALAEHYYGGVRYSAVFRLIYYQKGE